VTKKVHLDGVKLNEPRTLAVADLKNDGSPDLVVAQAGGETLVLQNAGANRNHWMHIDLKALNDNKSSIGTKLEILPAAFIKSGKLPGIGISRPNGPGLLVGLGKEKSVDVVRLLWPTGVPQDELICRAGNAGDCRARPAGKFVPDSFFVERERVRIYCGHDWAGSGGALGGARRAGCSGPRRVFESCGEKCARKERSTEFPVHGADGGDGLPGSGAAAGGGSSVERGSESERAICKRAAVFRSFA